MQRGVTTVVGILVVALAAWLVARSFVPPHAIGHDPSARDSGAENPDALLYAYTDAMPSEDAGPLFVGDITDLPFPSPRSPREDGGLLFDGTSIPPLPLTVPRQVRFGVVLVAYAGAQPSAAGGRLSSRPRSDARELAVKLSQTAAQDFRAAVQQGDPGSSDDVGTVKLGILEPGPEYVLFTLPVSGVGGPIDTPRGYWIVKRLE